MNYKSITNCFKNNYSVIAVSNSKHSSLYIRGVNRMMHTGTTAIFLVLICLRLDNIYYIPELR